MPSAIWVPNYAITASGREVDFAILFYAIWDLHEWGHITEWTMEEMKFWINSYKNGGALPGTRLFYDVHSGENVLFLQMLDGLIEMYMNAMDADDQTTEEEEVTEVLADVDIWFPWPINIGRFRLVPVDENNRFSFIH